MGRTGGFAMLGGVLLVLAGCVNHDHAPAARATPVPGINADGLVVGVEDVQRIANFDDLTSDPRLDVRAPGTLDADSPVPCRVVFDQQAAFGKGWEQFRSVWYSGASNKGVTQAVGVYPSETAARNAFDRITSALADCSALHASGFDFTTKKPDPSTVSVCFEQCRVMFRWKSSVLIDVSIQHFPHDGAQITSKIVQTISDRINSA